MLGCNVVPVSSKVPRFLCTRAKRILVRWLNLPKIWSHPTLTLNKPQFEALSHLNLGRFELEVSKRDNLILFPAKRGF